MNAIEVKSVNKRYKNFQINDLSLKIPTGSIVGLVGENGAGKSTTIKLIMDAISADSGYIKVLGVDNKDSKFIDVKEDIGVVLDEAYFPEVITPKIVNVIMKNTFKNWDVECFFNFLRKFKLNEKQKFKEFSRGMKMKLAIAVALSHKPKLLILDEATSGLDPIIRDEILDVFNDFTRDETHSILLSSHIVSDLEKICDYIALIHDGKLILCEEKDQLLENYGIIKTTSDNIEAIPKNAIKGKRNGKHGTEVLVVKSMVSSAFVFEHSTLEDIILLLVRGGN